MPVTIGTLTSQVDMIDANGSMNDAVIEKIVKLAVKRVMEQLKDEELARREREIRNHRSAKESV